MTTPEREERCPTCGKENPIRHRLRTSTCPDPFHDPPTDEGERVWTVYRFLDTPDGEPSRWFVTEGRYTHPKAECILVTPAPQPPTTGEGRRARWPVVWCDICEGIVGDYNERLQIVDTDAECPVCGNERIIIEVVPASLLDEAHRELEGVRAQLDNEQHYSAQYRAGAQSYQLAAEKNAARAEAAESQASSLREERDRARADAEQLRAEVSSAVRRYRNNRLNF